MPIRLFNKTPYDDGVLHRFLSFAHRAMGLKGTTAVKVTCNRRMYCFGEAYSWLPKHWQLKMKTKQVPESKRHTGPRGVDQGWVWLRIPHPKVMALIPALTTAENLLDTALHEFAHVKDNRSDFEAYNSSEFRGFTSSGRKVAWKKRPCEISAINQTDEVLKKIERNPRRKVLLNELVAEFEAKWDRTVVLPKEALDILRTLAEDDRARIMRHITTKACNGRCTTYCSDYRLETSDVCVPITESQMSSLDPCLSLGKDTVPGKIHAFVINGWGRIKVHE